MNPRAITGYGILSAVGIGHSAFVDALRNPIDVHTPPRPAETFDSSAYPHAALAEVRGFDPAKFLGDKGLRTLDRLTKLLVVAARLALQDAGIKRDNEYVHGQATSIGLCTSNAYGSLEAITEMDRVATLEDARYINPAKFPNTVANSAAGYVSIWENIQALNVSISDGNCGALDAFAAADIHLETRRAEVLLVGGAEAMSEALFLAFHHLGVLEQDAKLGEGAVLFAVEPLDHARSRGAKVIAEVIGFGTAFDPPADEGPLLHAASDAMGQAIRFALKDSGKEPRDIDLVVSGLSGVLAFDAAEQKAIQQTLGPYVPVTAPKKILGETLGAGGGMGMASALAVFEGALPQPLVLGSMEAGAKLETILVTSLGFYGNASAVVLQRPRWSGEGLAEGASAMGDPDGPR